MEIPLLPDNETNRIATLKTLEILDTAEEERFNRLTRLAKRIFDVPIALVSLIDENRQWFKSCIGLDVRETTRDISFCGHAILKDQIFLIPDASRDARFADNPLVTGAPFIRFYAGCPLTVLDNRLGTLCIIDTKPRHFSASDLLFLRDLAIMVERELVAVQYATTDELTQLANRRGFLKLAQNALELCLRHTIPSSLVFLDLDGFKQINDQFGHQEGDQALRTFARLLLASCRDADIIGRHGGDEFVLWLGDASSKYAEVLVQRFRAALDQENRVSARPYSLAFSAGIVAIDPRENLTLETILAQADSQMYRQKKPRPDQD